MVPLHKRWRASCPHSTDDSTCTARPKPADTTACYAFDERVVRPLLMAARRLGQSCFERHL